MYKLRIEKTVQKALEKLTNLTTLKLKQRFLTLPKNPRPVGYKKLKARDAFRIRVADYRIIYDVFDNILSIDVIDLGHRKDIYD